MLELKVFVSLTLSFSSTLSIVQFLAIYYPPSAPSDYLFLHPPDGWSPTITAPDPSHTLVLAMYHPVR
jgi:hypothetical protein